MFKLSFIPAAISVALCTNAFALDDSPTLDPLELATELMAVTTPTPVTSRATLVLAAPTMAETRARSYQGWLNQINKPYANQLGTGNGAGVTVGIVDTGVQVDHPSLKGQVLASYNAFTGGTDVTDQVGHGTHVSGIIAGTTASGGLTEGVAPGAKLVMAKVFQTGSSDSVTIGKGIDWVVNVQKAPILSLSLGSNAAAMQSNIQNAVTKGTLITAALGNDGKASASWPAEFAKATWANSQIIAVGALDANNKRASFSNYDPTLANWTVFAPGVNVASSYSTPTTRNAYAYMSGTSMATPIVAGEAALILSNWNFLRATDLAQIIFQSATHLCSDSVSAVACAARKTADSLYGWGLVNVGAALQPIGTLNMGTSTGALVNLGTSLLTSSKAGTAAGLKTLNSLAVDKFNRAFVVNVGAAVTSASTSTISSGIPATQATTGSVKGAKFSAEYTTQSSQQSVLGLDNSQGALTLSKVSYSFANDRGVSYGVGTGGTSSTFFGLQATGNAPLSLSGEASRFNAPYFGIADKASHMGYGSTLSDGTIMRMGALVQAAPVSTAVLGFGASSANMSLATVELQKSFADATGIVTVGHLQEAGAMLGMTGAGALALGGNANTTFVAFSASKPVSTNTTFSAMASLGQTSAYNNASASLIDGASASRSIAWSMGLAQKDVLRTGDNVGFTLAMPLRVMSGTMQTTTAVAQSQADGSLQFATQSMSMLPTGMEKDLEFAYSRPMFFGGSLTALAQAKFQPGHDADAATQYGLGLSYLRKF